MNPQAQWIDHFLFWDALIVTGLLFADWLIGKKQRKLLKEKLGEWWLYVEEISFVGLIAEDARRVCKAMDWIFGNKWYGLRCFILSVLISLITTFALILLILPSSLKYTLAHNNLTWMIKYTSIIDTIPISWSIFTTFAVPNAVFDWLSYGMTIVFLKLMARSVSAVRLFVLILLDILIAILLAYIAYYIGTYIHIIKLDPHNEYPLYLTIELELSRQAFKVVAFTSALPTLLHLLLSSVFLVSKLLRPVLVRPMSIILLRFYESPKGVLSQLAIGGGAIAKLAQVATKYFFSI